MSVSLFDCTPCLHTVHKNNINLVSNLHVMVFRMGACALAMVVCVCAMYMYKISQVLQTDWTNFPSRLIVFCCCCLHFHSSSFSSCCRTPRKLCGNGSDTGSENDMEIFHQIKESGECGARKERKKRYNNQR